MTTTTDMGNQIGQIEGESDFEYAVFLVYAMMPTPRVLKDVSEKFSRSSSWASKLCKKNKWEDRVIKSENDQMVSLAILKDKELKRRAEDIADRRVDVASKAVMFTEELLQAFIDKFQRDGVEDMCSLHEFIKFGEFAMKFSRLEYGQPTTIKEINQRSVIQLKTFEVEVPHPPMLVDDFADDVEEGEWELEELEQMTPE